MMYSIDDQKIKDKAEMLLQSHGYFALSQFPLPVEQIARNLGYQVYAFIPDHTTAMISGAISKQKKEILVNRTEPYERQRFTLAHEVGHAILHFPNDPPDSEFVDYRMSGHKTARELEANEFAAALLMPEIHFRKAWDATGGNYYELAQIFYVSQAAVGFRAFNLNV